MAEYKAVFERWLMDILTTDDEVRRRLAEADTNADAVRRSVVRRMSEGEPLCTAEYEALRKRATDLVAMGKAIQRIRDGRSRPEKIILYALWLVAAIVVPAYGFVWVAWGLMGRNGPGRDLWDLFPEGLLYGPLAFAVLLAGILALRQMRHRKADDMAASDAHRLLKAQFETAQTDWERAVRDRAVLPLVRQEINDRLPDFGRVLRVREVSGLAESRNPQLVIDTHARRELQTLIETMPSGSFGIAGPRGAGKSTLLRRFCEASSTAEPASPVRIMVSAPVKYDPKEFILHLFASVCRGVLSPGNRAEYQIRHAVEPRSDVSRLLASVALPAIVALGASWGSMLIASVLFNWTINANLYPGIFLLAISVVGAAVLPVIRRRNRLSHRYLRADDHDDRSSIQGDALALLAGLDYQHAVARGWSSGIKPPIGIEASMNASITMTERPMSYPELVGRCTDFLRQVSQRRAVIVGIDELDKLDSDDDAYRFLNDIKSIFGLDRCYYLVSISESAMGAFERRGLPVRDAFDSAFDQVVLVSCMQFVDSRRLIRQRVIGMSEPFIALSHVLSGGLPRDLIRFARAVASQAVGDTERDLTEVVHDIVAADLASKVDATRIFSQQISLEPEVGDLIAELPDGFSSNLTLLPNAGSLRKILVADRGRGQNATKNRQEAQVRLTRLRVELATYLYFSETVIQYFSGLGATLAVGESERSGPDQLARARAAFAINARLAWERISDFRSSEGMEVDSYPIAVWHGAETE